MVSIFFFLPFSLPILSGHRLDVYHTSTHDVALVPCEFRMHVWSVLHAARWKYRTQNIATKLPPAHHRTSTSLSGYIFATATCIDNQRKIC